MSENDNGITGNIDNAQTVENTEVTGTPTADEVTGAVEAPETPATDEVKTVETPETTVEDVTDTADIVQSEEAPEYVSGEETLKTAQAVYSETVEPTETAGGEDAVYTVDEDVPEDSKILGILSMILGIVSVTFGCCGFCFCSGWFGVILSVSAVVLGIVSLAKRENAKGMAIAGIVCGGVGVLLAVIMTIKDPATFVFESIDRNQLEDYVDRIDEIL